MSLQSSISCLSALASSVFFYPPIFLLLFLSLICALFFLAFELCYCACTLPRSIIYSSRTTRTIYTLRHPHNIAVLHCTSSSSITIIIVIINGGGNHICSNMFVHMQRHASMYSRSKKVDLFNCITSIQT